MMTLHPVLQDIEQKLQAGLEPIQGKTILHTAPHHDDILLGYFPYFMRNLQGNTHHVLYMTSGANGVSDTYLAHHLCMTHEQLALLDDATRQELKYRIRESESEKKWSLCADGQVQMHHARSEFYDVAEAVNTGDGLEESLEIKKAMDKDVQRMVDCLKIIQPDIITLLVDAPGIGPLTHHRSQQVIARAIAQWQSLGGEQAMHVKIIGYRNVWSTFSLDEASMIVLVGQDELNYVESIFTQCFATQATKMFIASDTNEFVNFAEEASALQRAQYQHLVHVVGKSFQNYQAAIFLQLLQLQELHKIIR